ncbi:MAG: SoxR reducing system RseC family protein [Nitrospirota bacterium]
MKPSIPEIGTVIRLQGDIATVMLKGGESCKGCGQAKIGLCKAGGTTMMLTVKNPIDAKIGDSVTVGIDKGIKTKGYFLAFIIPLLSLIFGALAGHIVGKHLSIPSLEVMAGFITLLLVSFFSFRRLKILDSSSSMAIKSVISDNRFSESIESDEMRRYSEYLV